MTARIVSISAAPYDGYAFPDVLESLASCGVRHVEPAFIVGYTEPFDEGTFSDSNTTQYAAWLHASGIGCHAFSSHIDLGRADAVNVFLGRMDFAARLGAKVINTNAAARSNAASFFRNIQVLARHAERLGMIIGLENPGDGSDNLFNTAADGIALLKEIGHPCVRLNYDAGNTISHRPPHWRGGVDPAADALLAMPYCGHVHVKDVRVTADGYYFVPLGQGDIACDRIVHAVAAAGLDCSIELPLRLHRAPNAQPRRAGRPVPLPELESAIKTSLAFVERNLVAAPGMPIMESV
jgi:sugar phosphate isomerase/epimerase